MKDAKFYDTHKLMVYSELLTKMIGDLDEFGMQATRAYQDGIITEKEMQSIHKKLTLQIERIEPKRILLITELNKRFKADTGLSKGPSDLSKYLYDLNALHPDLFLSKSEYEFKKSRKREDIIMGPGIGEA